MSWRMLIVVLLCVVAVGRSAMGEGASVYAGTFKDANGRKGPLTCELSAAADGKWTAKFAAENQGSGPQRPFKCTTELTGKEDGANVNLTGEVVMRRGAPYVVSAVLADNSLKATFKTRAGKGDGSFDLALGQATAGGAE